MLHSITVVVLMFSLCFLGVIGSASDITKRPDNSGWEQGFEPMDGHDYPPPPPPPKGGSGG